MVMKAAAATPHAANVPLPAFCLLQGRLMLLMLRQAKP
jgi:hypothetical protein